MAQIGFIGLGNMGGPMAANLIKAGHRVSAFDLSDAALDAHIANGGMRVDSVAAAVKDAAVVITMLPAGKHVRDVYLGPDGVLAHAQDQAVLIDSSTIDVDSARAVIAAADDTGFLMVDAPVSGGVAGASAGSLTFMVGGSEAAFAAANPYLDIMGKTIVHAGGAGNGQAAKICNNMILGVSMIAVAEAFELGKKLGLDADKLFAISSTASGQCWSMTSYCPEPGLVETAPSNKGYQPGFAAAMMLKDLNLSQQAAAMVAAQTPMGASAADIYSQFCEAGGADTDFSGIIKMLAAPG